MTLGETTYTYLYRAPLQNKNRRIKDVTNTFSHEDDLMEGLQPKDCPYNYGVQINEKINETKKR